KDQQIVPLRDFYSKLRIITRTDGTEWNIEGSAVITDSLYLLNRGNNLIIIIRVSSFLEYLFQSGVEFPAIRYYRLALPRIQNKEARLSGACGFKDKYLL